MTILNFKPLRGTATPPIGRRKRKRANIYYAIHGDGKLVAIVDFSLSNGGIRGGYGLGGACVVEDEEGHVLVSGYLYNPNLIYIYKNQRQFHKRCL